MARWIARVDLDQRTVVAQDLCLLSCPVDDGDLSSGGAWKKQKNEAERVRGLRHTTVPPIERKEQVRAFTSGRSTIELGG